MLRVETNAHWVGRVTEGVPDRWKKRLLAKHGRMLGEFDASTIGGKNQALFAGNVFLRETLERLQAVRLPLDASDGDVCARAAELAAECMSMSAVYHQVESVRDAMERITRNNGIEPPCRKEIAHQGAIARMTCRDWWRRGLRKLHATAVEGAAIELGYVNRARDCYVSNESVARRGQQVRRNQRMLENTLMRNEEGQEYTLAELSAKGVANKSIRRGELMTRIAGFEKIARDCGHECLFLTPTCPSRMHKWTAHGGGGVFENPRYDGTTPREAQSHLSRCYARIRAKLARDKVGVYGFRVAEPHHDGCPHWHIILFHEAGRGAEVEAVFRRYLLADSPDEPGAALHRCKVKVIDLSAGSAAGYIAKYISKNIDGYRVGEDLYGNPALETCQRVEAWASTWGIRQFQQIGGAPVGVWRELRRVKGLDDGVPEALRKAHEACNRVVLVLEAEPTEYKPEGEAEQVGAASFADYCEAQGGVFVGRKYRIRLVLEEGTGELGRYGDLKALRPVGVMAVGLKKYMIGRFEACAGLVEWVVKSVRHVWERVVKGAVSSPPWTRVNNCTRKGMGCRKTSGRGCWRTRSRVTRGCLCT